MSNETHSERVRWIAVATTDEDDDWCIRREGEFTGASVAQMLWKRDAEEIVTAHNAALTPAETHSEKGQCENCELLQAKLDATLALMEVHELDFKQQLSAMPHSEKGLRELVAKWRRQAEKEVSTELKDKHYTIMVAMCEQMDRCADELEQALAATPAVRDYPHQPENLACECYDCQKNAIEQLSHQLDVERGAVREPGPTRLTEEQVRTTVLGLSWIPLNYRHDVLRNIMPFPSSSSAGEAAHATHKDSQ